MAKSKGSLAWPAVWALAAGGMVGGGIYTALGVVIAVAGEWAWLSFLISGILAFCTAYSYCELSVQFDESGGAFRFMREINKNGIAGSLSWLLIIGYILTISVYAFAFGHYLSYALGTSTLITRAFALAIVACMVGLNLLGVTKTKNVEIIIVLVNLLALIALAIIGMMHWDSIQLTAGIEPRPWWSASIGAASIFMAYEGFQLLTYEYDEIKNPKKILKPTILYAVFFVIIIYILVALGATMLAGAIGLIDQKQVALSVAARQAIGWPGLLVMTIAAVFATAAAINSTLFSTSNLSKRVADDGELPSFFEHTNSKGIPDRSVILIGICAAVLAMIGKLSTLVEAASLVFIFTFGAVNVIAASRVKKSVKWIPVTGCVLACLIGLTLIARLAIISPVPLAILVFFIVIIIFFRPLLLKKTK
ncbi:APC family permease [Mucilaginibacter segetis]|uniref:Amino acid permease n=1 Tax=Mucilaginibacter segetis TaxID=2793071 RepID=A0A934PTL1_9SPHI|nr:APC family permease [Mucilaginibacter segetis]MBK0378926.1 amino acid permease [Mucilaginibacter segetis]